MGVTTSQAKNLANGLEVEMNLPKDSLFNCFLFETIGSLNPAKQNPSTLATGLIQFMPSTARSLGTTVTALASMSYTEQLQYVKKYFNQNGYTKKVAVSRDPLDIYLAVFFPASIGKPDSYVIKTSNLSAATIARQNPVFDVNKDKQITKGEIRKKYSEVVNSHRKRLGLSPASFTRGILGSLGDIGGVPVVPVVLAVTLLFLIVK